MTQPDVTVIIGAYEAMPYLVECLASVEAQTIDHTRIEVIAVDDGSTDGTGACLEEFAGRADMPVTVIRQDNSGGPSAPRNVGLGKAAEICRLEMATESERLRKLRDRLNQKLHANLDELYINGSMEHRLPHNLNVSFAYVEGESLLMGINDVAVSSGSACTSASLEPSYVLKALGVGDELAHSSLRFGLGRFTTEEEVDYVIDRVIKEVDRLREMSPLYELAKEGVDLSTVKWAAH